ncbi:MAG: 2Fe-2S iron-sulfur cluster-binding protein [Myxococcota bacterium]
MILELRVASGLAAATPPSTIASPHSERYSTKIVPSIEFLVNAIGRAKRVDAPEGGELVDICDEYLAPIPFSCRSASCGTCHVQILEGAELFEPPGPAEAELLALLGGGPDHRLACQARIRSGPGVIRLRAVLGG